MMTSNQDPRHFDVVVPATLRVQMPDPLDPFCYSTETKEAAAAVADAIVVGGTEAVARARWVFLRVSIAFGWPNATRAIFARTEGGSWALVQVYAGGDQLLREWVDGEQYEFSDESERERFAMWLVSDSPPVLGWRTAPTLNRPTFTLYV